MRSTVLCVLAAVLLVDAAPTPRCVSADAPVAAASLAISARPDELCLHHPRSAWADLRRAPVDDDVLTLGEARNGERVRLAQARFSAPTLAGDWALVELLSGPHRHGLGWVPRAWIRRQQSLHVEGKQGELLLAGEASTNRQLVEALQLLAQRAPAELDFVLQSTDRVAWGARSGAHGSSSEVSLHSWILDADLATLAAVLVHEATHLAVARGTPEHPLGSVTDSTTNELLAIERERQALIRLGGSPYRIRWLAAQDGTHWDVDGDGEHTWHDWELQDW